MKRIDKIKKFRKKLINKLPSIGSWIQCADPNTAEIMGNSGYDWLAIDMEHGSIDINNLPNIFRSIELGDSLPLVRIPDINESLIKRVMDAGSGGIIVPKIESKDDAIAIKNFSSWPPNGKRGIGYSRANNFGKNFDKYLIEAQRPILVGMIESLKGIKNIHEILKQNILDSILIGPYDLSASLEITGNLKHIKFKKALNEITKNCRKFSTPHGIHIVEPNIKILQSNIKDNMLFNAYGTDMIFIHKNSKNPLEY